MVATTNLEQNFDKAFERLFLYKRKLSDIHLSRIINYTKGGVYFSPYMQF